MSQHRPESHRPESRRASSRRARTIAIAVVAAAALVALTGCSGISASRTGAGLTPSTIPTLHPRDGSNANLGGTGTGGAGSLTVALSEPIAVAGHVNTTVACVTGRHYTATAGPVVLDGTSISIEVVVAGYSAPGAYSAIVTASVTPSGSDGTDVAGLPGIPVTITSLGGTVNLSATGTAGRVIAGSISWACS